MKRMKYVTLRIEITLPEAAAKAEYERLLPFANSSFRAALQPEEVPTDLRYVELDPKDVSNIRPVHHA